MRGLFKGVPVEQRLKDEQRKKDLIIGISHDLRTPLVHQRVSGQADGWVCQYPEKGNEYLSVLIKQRGKGFISPW